ncbi:MAG: Ig-like domain-containing protein, partial [Armatimonadetes bacterium]|nr:Ig-like domain-containing protein [Armatimonadota bacterium]
FIVGGWQNSRTAIVKQGRILAETTDPKCLMPVFEDQTWGGYEFHRKWWGIRARKVGNLLQLYVDEKLACEARDPAPLPGGRVALWGYDNRIVLARVGIWYEALAQPQPPLPPEKWTVRAELAADGRKAVPANNTQAVANLPPPKLSVSTLVGNDFENNVEPLQPRAPGFAKITLASPGAEGSARCLKIINTGPGGVFGVDIAPKPFDAAQLPILEFDYRVGPDVKVNLYAQVNDRTYEIIFTGRPDGAGLADLAGRIENVQADGQWHHARVDLGALLRQAARAWAADTLQVTALWFGNLNERDYLGAGFGGNAAGASWSLDNLRLYGPVAKLVIAPPRPPAGKNLKGVAWLVDQSPMSEPPRDAVQAPADKEVMASKSGWWYVHAACQLDDGTWLGTAHAPVAIDVDAPTAALMSPAPGSLAGDEDIIVGISDPPFNAINWRSVQLRIASKTLQPGQPGVTIDPAASRVVVEPGLAGLTFESGKPVQVELTGLRDVAGNALSGPLSWTFTYSAEKDKRAPRIAGISLGRKYLADADFETEITSMESYSGGGGAFLALDRSKAASGKASLRLTNPSEMGRFGVRLVNQPFDAGVYRLVSLDYCILPHYRGDFAVYVNGDWKGIKFTDTDNPIGYIGKIEDVRADGKWHHLEFNLYDMLVADDPTAPAYRVDWFVLSDWGPITANFRRREIWLDNFQIAPVVSGLEPIKASVVAADPGGIGGVAWVLDVLSSTAVPKQPNAEKLEFDVPPKTSGLYWFCAKAYDTAGNVSAELSRRFLVDAERPQASAVGPADGQRAAESEIQLVLDDRGPAGIDPTSVVLKVADRDYRCDRAGLTYNAATRRLVWNCEKVSPQPVVFADGQRIEVKLV